MKRHVSIFALLLSVFAAVGARQAVADDVVVISDRSDLSVNGISEFIDSGVGYYYGRAGANSSLILSSVPSGYRFLGWYTMEANDDDSKGGGTSPVKCTKLLTSDQEITAAKIGEAATSVYWGSHVTTHVVCPQLKKTWTITTAVSPAGAGTVSISGTNGVGTVDAGGSVTLTATPNPGYEFSKWSDDETTNPRTISNVMNDATYTAVFTAKGYSVLPQPKYAKITVEERGTYDKDLKISWEPEGEAGYDYTFASAQVLDGKTTRKEYTSGTSATFNMEKDYGKFFDPVTVEVTYNRTSRNYLWTIDVSSIGIASVRYKIGSGEYQETATNLTVAVPYGTQLEAYAIGEEFYIPEYNVDRKWTDKMPADKLTFKPTATLDGYRLTIDPAGGKFMGDVQPRTLVPLQYGTTNLNAIAAATDGPGVFLGYFTKSDPVGEKVYGSDGKNIVCEYWTDKWPDGKFQGDKDLQLEARWGRAPLIAVRAEPESAGTVEGGGRILEGDPVTLIAAVTNSGYSFCCWTNLAAVGEADYGFTTNANPWTFTSAKDVEFAALFTGNVYTVTFMAFQTSPKMISGTANPTQMHVTYGSSYGQLPTADYSDDTYALAGWYTRMNASGTLITEESIVTVLDDNQVLYGYAVPKATYTIAYDGNGETSGTMAEQTALCGADVKLAANKFKRTGYTFLGWAKEKTATEPTYDDGAIVKDLTNEDETATLFAVWTPHTYIVTFDGNESDGGDEMSPQDFTYDVEQALASNTFTRTGKEFAGWATSKSGAVVYTNGERVVNLTDEDGATVQLFAKWANPSYSDNPLSVAADCDRERDDGRQPLDLISESTDCVSFDVADKGGNNKAVKMLTSDLVGSAKMEAQLFGSGTLKFYYKTSILHPQSHNSVLKFVVGDDSAADFECRTSVDEWTEYVRHYDAAEGAMARWSFAETIFDNGYALIDNIRWIPDGDGPKYADDDTPVTGFSRTDGKLVFAFDATNDVASTYHLLGTNDLVAPMPWPMVFETNKASGTIHFDIPVKADEPKMFYRIRELK